MPACLSRRLVVAAFVAVVLVSIPATALADPPRRPPHRSSVVVAVSDAKHMASVRAALETAGGSVRQVFRWNAFLVSAPLRMDSTQFSAKVQGVHGVRYAQGNATRYAMSTTNDPLFPQQWGLPDIGTPTAWDSTEGSGTAVAIIDTGIDSTHPDLAANVVMYKNYVTPGATPEDDNLHGTHVAGIVAEIRNNSLQGAGTAPKAKVWAFKVLDASGSGTDANIALAIRDAVDLTPCRILSMSLGGTAYDQTLADAVSYAQSKGAVVVAAAGNSNSTAPSYPAAFPRVVGVGAVDSTNVRASFSNYGSTNCDIVAPGVNILSTVLAGGTAMESGTSMATPFVSGVAALVWSKFPSLDATSVINILQNSAQDLGAVGVDQFYGHGLVRADLALAAAAALDTTAPVTTSDAAASYANAAVIHLIATDNVGGSGVAHTYYKVDGGAQTEGATTTVTTYGAHSIEFWSVDNAGNIETPHKTASFTVNDTIAPVTTSDAVATYTGSATIHLTATDNTGGSGVAHTYYKLDGGAQTTGLLVSTSVVGAHAVEFWSDDVAGNAEAPHKTANFTVNPITITPSSGPNGAIAPATPQVLAAGSNATFTMSPNAGYNVATVTVDGVPVGSPTVYAFTNVQASHTIAVTFADRTAPVTISDAVVSYVNTAVIHLSATDAGSGVAHTYYKLDSGAQTEGATITVTTYGAHSIEFWSVDAAGNVETPHKTASFTIDDNIAPVTTSDAVATYSGSATIHLAATDNVGGSGVAHTYYRLDGGVQTEGTVITTSAAGAHTLEFWSVDVTGNIETPHKTVGFTVNPVTVTYTITPSAGPNGSIAPATAQVVAAGSNTTFTMSPNAGYSVATVTVDGVAVGSPAAYGFTNVQANHTIAVTFADRTAPVTTSDAAPTYANSGTIHLSATDAGSGVAHTYYKLDSGAQTEGTTIVVSTYGAHKIEFWSVDAAGNVETHTVFILSVDDTIAPTTVSDAVAVYRLSATIHLTATDNAGGSGVAHTYYKLDGGAQTEATVIATSITGAHTLEFWSVDVVGNAETPHETAAFTVSAVAVNYAITPSAGTGGSISPSTVQTVASGSDSPTFSITPSSGFHIADVLVDGSSVGAVAAYKFTGVTANHTISALFAADAVVPVPTSISIRTNATSVTRGKSFILSGVVAPASLVGTNIQVMVKYPTKAYYSYSSLRTCYMNGAVPSWWYRYTAVTRQPVGVYKFYSFVPASATFAYSKSPVLNVTFK